MIENYSIYDFISFSLINKSNVNFPFLLINPEYKYFQSNKKNKNHFEIFVNQHNINEFNILEKNKKKWGIDINSYLSNQSFNIYPHSLGIIKPLSFLIFKNIYVRSLLSYQIINTDASLVHSCAFKINNKSFILAGRPGVFKTSILMDAIKHYYAEFIGEENCLIYQSKVYPFPLNIDSISYKIGHYTSENASGKIQKIKLGLHLLKHIKTKNFSLPLAEPCKIQNVFYLSKGDNYNIKEVRFESILPFLIENELEELSIPPTHSLSGINYNYFKEELNKIDKNHLENFTQKLKNIFSDNSKNARFFLVTSPKTYSKSFTDNLIRFIEQ